MHQIDFWSYIYYNGVVVCDCSRLKFLQASYVTICLNINIRWVKIATINPKQSRFDFQP